MDKKKPLETKIPKNTEVKPSIEIQIQKQKKILNLIWHWIVTAPQVFPPVREFILIPNKDIKALNQVPKPKCPNFILTENRHRIT